jgi:hypothetical protein
LTADELHRIDEITLELEKLEREFMPTINWWKNGKEIWKNFNRLSANRGSLR